MTPTDAQIERAAIEKIAAKLLSSVNAPEQVIYRIAREIVEDHATALSSAEARGVERATKEAARTAGIAMAFAAPTKAEAFAEMSPLEAWSKGVADHAAWAEQVLLMALPSPATPPADFRAIVTIGDRRDIADPAVREQMMDELEAAFSPATPPAEPELKPCPFGCEPGRTYVTRLDDSEWAVICPGCGANGPATETKAAAILAWNTRAPLAVELPRSVKTNVNDFVANLDRKDAEPGAAPLDQILSPDSGLTHPPLGSNPMEMARNLAVALYGKYFKEIAPTWKPAHRLTDIILQIDNMTTAIHLSSRREAFEEAALKCEELAEVQECLYDKAKTTGERIAYNQRNTALLRAATAIRALAKENPHG